MTLQKQTVLPGLQATDIPVSITADRTDHLIILVQRPEIGAVLVKRTVGGTAVWEYKIPGIPSNNACRVVVDYHDNIYVACGEMDNPDASTIRKLTPSGELLYVTELLSTRKIKHIPNGLVADVHGNCYITGDSWNEDDGPSVFVTKLDYVGRFLWSYQNPALLHESFGVDIDIDRDGNICVVGKNIERSGGVTTSTMTIFDTFGTVVAWRGGKAPGNVEAKRVVYDGNGDVVVFGLNHNGKTYDGVVTKLSPTGETIWEYRLLFEGYNFAARAVAIGKNDSIVLIGNCHHAQHGYCAFILVLDSNGDLLSQAFLKSNHSVAVTDAVFNSQGEGFYTATIFGADETERYIGLIPTSDEIAPNATWYSVPRGFTKKLTSSFCDNQISLMKCDLAIK